MEDFGHRMTKNTRRHICFLTLAGLAGLWLVEPAFADDCFNRLLNGDLSMSDCANTVWDQVAPILSSGLTILAIAGLAIAAASIGGPLGVMLGLGLTAMGMVQSYQQGGIRQVWHDFTPFDDALDLLTKGDQMTPWERLMKGGCVLIKTVGMVTGVTGLSRGLLNLLKQAGKTRHLVQGGRGLNGLRSQTRGERMANRNAKDDAFDPFRFLDDAPKHPPRRPGRPMPVRKPSWETDPSLKKAKEFMDWQAKQAAKEAYNKAVRPYPKGFEGGDPADTLKFLQRSDRFHHKYMQDAYGMSSKVKMRDVPLSGQGTYAQYRNNTCWAGTMRGVFRDLGAPQVSEQALVNVAWHRYGKSVNGGLTPEQSVDIARSFGLKADVQRFTSVNDIQKVLNQGDTAVTASIRTSSGSYHRVRVEGVVNRPDGRYVAIGDPANGRSWDVPVKDFMKIASDNRYIVISK